MLHIVQTVLWGAAETPQVFGDEERARAAYVASAKKNWERRYAAYCEHHGLSGDAFESARSFVSTLDPSEKSAVHCWTLDTPEADIEGAQGRLCGEEMKAFRDLSGRISAAKAELTRLLDELSILTGRLTGTDDPPVPQPAATAPATEPPPFSPAPPEEPEADPATRATPEWKALVGTVMRLGSGISNDFHLLPRDAWRQDVYSDRTSLEYWDWVADRIGKLRERAQNAGYSVAESPDAPGRYRFVNAAGAASAEGGGSEWEAWCAAGLDLEAGCREKAG